MLNLQVYRSAKNFYIFFLFLLNTYNAKFLHYVSYSSTVTSNIIKNGTKVIIFFRILNDLNKLNMKNAVKCRWLLVHMKLSFAYRKWHDFIVRDAKSGWSKYVETINNGVFVVQMDIKYL